MNGKVKIGQNKNERLSKSIVKLMQEKEEMFRAMKVNQMKMKNMEKRIKELQKNQKSPSELIVAK